MSDKEVLDLTVGEVESLLAACMTVLTEFHVPDDSVLRQATEKLCSLAGIDRSYHDILKEGAILMAEEEAEAYGKLDS